MLKFTMNVKELKNMLEKGMAAVNKKATLPALTKLYLQVEADGTVKVLGTDLDHYAEIRSYGAWKTSPGVLGIDTDDIKVISKVDGNITLEDVSTETENKINVRSGKKIVGIPKYDNTDIFLPSMDNTEGHILTMKESWLLETIVNLSTYTSDNDSNKMMQVFHFNTKDKRVEALDGHRIGIRTLENQKIEKEIDNPFDSVKIHKKCVPVFKKIMNTKSDAEVKMYQDKKYIRVEGKNFTYIIRRIDGKYFDIDNMLTDARDYVFTADRKNMLSVMKYNCDLAKSERMPVVFHSENGKLYTYMTTSRYETFDELETENLFMAEQLYIGFNPGFISDVFAIIDTENPVCRGTNNLSPMFIDGDEYKFLILPTSIKGMNMEEKIRVNIDRVA